MLLVFRALASSRRAEGQARLLLPLLFALILVAPGCDGRLQNSDDLPPDPGTAGGESAGPAPTSGAAAEQAPRRSWALLVHGGLQDGSEQAEALRERLDVLADAGAQRLAEGQASLQVVADLIAELEEDPSFNAGRGATFNRRGVHEMSAALMDGRSRAFGAVGGLRNIQSPIAAARGALEHHQGGLLLGDPADQLGRTLSLPRAPQDSFTTRSRFEAWRSFRQEARRVERDGGRLSPPVDPVGALALDSFGNLAAGVSFGGYTDAVPEQPVALATVGAGVYADNDGAAVLAVGPEDRLISCQFPSTVAAGLRTSQQAAASVLEAAVDGCGGAGPLALLAIDAAGHVAILTPNDGAPLLFVVREADDPVAPDRDQPPGA